MAGLRAEAAVAPLVDVHGGRHIVPFDSLAVSLKSFNNLRDLGIEDPRRLLVAAEDQVHRRAVATVTMVGVGGGCEPSGSRRNCVGMLDAHG